MAGRLLFIVLICSFQETQVQALPQAKLTVNPAVITETDSVVLSCEAPSHVSVFHCYFYTGKETFRNFECVQTLTGTDLLLMSRQSSPAEVEVKCFYTVKYGDVNSPSPHSDVSSITVQGQKPEMSLQHTEDDHIFICSLPGSVEHGATCNLYFGEESHPVVTTKTWKTRSSKTNQLFCLFAVKADDLLRHLHSVQQKDASCDYRLENKPNYLSPRSDKYNLMDVVAKESSKISTKPTFPVIPDVVATESNKISTKPVTTADATAYSSSVLTPTTTVSTASDVVATESNKTSTKPVTTDSTVYSSSVLTPPTSVSTASGSQKSPGYTPVTASLSPTSDVTTAAEITRGLTPENNNTDVVATESSKNSKTTSFPVTPETSKWMLVVVVVCCGAAVVVILIVLVFLGTKRRRGWTSRSTVDDSEMRNTDHGGLLLDQNYSEITSVPAAGFPVDSEKLSRKEMQTEHSDIYHVYATIPEEPAASAHQDMAYNVLQPH